MHKKTEKCTLRFFIYKKCKKQFYFYTCILPALQSRTGPVQGLYRDFPVYFSHTGKNLFSLQGSKVMKTGFSLLGKVHREIPVFITGMGLQCGLKSR